MCFSATASFGAGIVLSIAGVVAICKAKTPGQRVFACIPAFFAAQQISEGFVWMGLSNSNYKPGLQAATYSFLIFAQIVWAIWIPFSLMLLENNRQRKRLFSVFLGLGILLSAYHAWGLIVQPITGEALDCHIFYHVEYLKKYKLISGFIYGVVTIIPCFFSSVKRMWLLGLVFLLSYIFTQIFYKYYVISVWCFFAALLSMVVIFILHKMNTKEVAIGECFGRNAKS